MSKATAGDEIPKLAEAHGFKRTITGLEGERVGYLHPTRREAFILQTEDGAFAFATWHGPEQWVTIVDRREPGARGQDGNHLTGNAKRRPVGVGDVRGKLLRSPGGLEVGYMDIKRRIKNEAWLEAVQ